MHRYVLALLIVASPFSAFAGELPKEGSYDFTSCFRRYQRDHVLQDPHRIKL